VSGHIFISAALAIVYLANEASRILNGALARRATRRMGRLDLKSNGLHRAHRIFLCLPCASPGRNNQTGDEANGLMLIPVAWERHRTPLLGRVEATETASSEGPLTAQGSRRRHSGMGRLTDPTAADQLWLQAGSSCPFPDFAWVQSGDTCPSSRQIICGRAARFSVTHCRCGSADYLNLCCSRRTCRD
jgi:hypothetical protein